MNISKIHILMASLYEFTESTTLGGVPIPDNVARGVEKLADMIADEYLNSDTIAAPKESKPKADDSQFSDDLLDKAYNILKDESKPSHALLMVDLSMNKKRATAVYLKLCEQGRFTPPVKETKKKSAKKDIMTVINDLPDGNDLLIKAPFNLLIVLDKNKRTEYLTGLKIKDMIDPQSLATAAVNGVDRTLISQIVELTDEKREPVKKALTNIGVKGDADGELYAKYLTAWLAVIPEGDVLYNHMVKMGCSKRTLNDIKTIATAVKKGDV